MTGTCSVCGREVTIGNDGTPARRHQRVILHNPDADPEHHVTTSIDCRGFNRPAVGQPTARERVLAKIAARKAAEPDPARPDPAAL